MTIMKNLFGSHLFVLAFIIKLISAEDGDDSSGAEEETEDGMGENSGDPGEAENINNSDDEAVAPNQEESDQTLAGDNTEADPNQEESDQILAGDPLEPAEEIQEDLNQDDNKSKKNHMLMIGAGVLIFVVFISFAMGNKKKKSIAEENQIRQSMTVWKVGSI